MEIVKELVNNKEKMRNSMQNAKQNFQHQSGRLTPMERINMLFDEDSFVEIGAMSGKDGAGVLTGYGTVGGKLAFTYIQDYAVNGGALDSFGSKKIVRIMDMAVKMGAPLIEVYDSVGAKLTEGIGVLEAYGSIISRNAKLSGVVPQIAVVAGPCTGIAALSAAMSDFSIIVQKTGELYINSPKKLTECEGTNVSSNMYADSENCIKNGSVQVSVSKEEEGLLLVKKLINYIPSNNLEVVQMSSDAGAPDEVQSGLDDIVNKGDIKIDTLLNTIADSESVIEFDKSSDMNIKTALIKINGMTAGTAAIGNGGRLNIKSIEKITRMVKFCNCFNIPILCMVNSEGFIQNICEENSGLSSAAARMICALNQAVVPKVSLITGKAYGAIYTAFCSKETACDVVYAWPGAKISLAEPEEIIKALYKDEIILSEEPKKKETEIIKEKTDEVTSPYKAAEMGYLDDIIIPSKTKGILYETFDMLQSKRVVNYPKKHVSVLL